MHFRNEDSPASAVSESWILKNLVVWVGVESHFHFCSSLVYLSIYIICYYYAIICIVFVWFCFVLKKCF